MKNIRRKDIDVLRAFAVLPVIIYHFNQNLFPLGYLGVDIFFVISGYLISQIILKNFFNRSFSFYDFYIRRIKRILPAFLTVITFSLLASLLIFFTSDIKIFLKSLISSLFFIPNFFFWITGGYFGQNEGLKPLLHLWSLGIEGQFYISCPILFYIFFKIKLSIKNISFFIFLISLVSFLLNVFFISKGHRDSLFFLFPFRIWEFGLGILAALANRENIKYIFFEKFRTLIGLSLIIVNYIFKFNFIPDSTLICVGCALLLFKENSSNYIFNKIFNLNILIFIGLISYSLYLWHWPIAAFLKYISVDKLSNIHTILGICLTFLLSFYSWKYIERPFAVHKTKSKNIVKNILISHVLLVSISLIILSAKNFPSKHSNYLNNFASEIGSTYRCSFLNYNLYGDSFGCLMNSKVEKDYKVAIYGNSHAAMYGWAINKKINENNSKALLLHLNHCLPLIDKNSSSGCLRKAKNYFKAIIEDEKIKTVVIGLTWSTKVKIDEKDNSLIDNDFIQRNKSLIYLIDELVKKKKEVHLIGPLETPNFDPYSEVRKLAFKKVDKINLAMPKKNFLLKYSKTIDLFSEKMGDNFLRPDKILCDKMSCFFGDAESLFFSDKSHLSKSGSLKMLELFKKIRFN